MLHLEVLRLLHTEIPIYYCQIGPKNALTPTYLAVSCCTVEGYMSDCDGNSSGRDIT